MGSTVELGVGVRTAAALWYGPAKRAVRRAVLVSGVERRGKVVLGPMRGRRFWHGPIEVLGAYEPDMQALLVRYLSPGGVFFDVGANYGFFSLLGATLVGPSGKVVALEPMPKIAEELRRMLAANDVGWAEVVEAAASDLRGASPMFFGKHSASATLGVVEGRGTVNVETVTLDGLCGLYGMPSFVKMDIEGGEVDALRGAERMLSEGRPVLAVELHTADKYRNSLDLLAAAGYRIVEEQPRRPDRDYPVHVLAVP